jgi:hypothetical protein
MSTCFCIGPQNGEPYCPCRMRDLGIVKRNGRWVQPEKDLGPIKDIHTKPFDAYTKQCASPEHNPPMHLYIPPGESYTHVCPACGKETVLKSPNITFSDEDYEDEPTSESLYEMATTLKIK